MTRSIEWGFFDRKAHTDDSKRYLPHKEQAGAITFVTMRLADSMPKHVVRQWHDEVDDWLVENGLAGRSVESILDSGSVSFQLKRELRKFRNRRWHSHLDKCHGECVLKDASLRSNVSETILHFDNDRYDVESFVVMPNHAHVLIQMRDGFSLRKQLREIQRYSAREINKRLGRSGELWQGEPFDHIVRHSEQLEYLHQYVLDNPKKANLQEAEYSYWSC